MTYALSLLLPSLFESQVFSYLETHLPLMLNQYQVNRGCAQLSKHSSLP